MDCSYIAAADTVDIADTHCYHRIAVVDHYYRRVDLDTHYQDKQADSMVAAVPVVDNFAVPAVFAVVQPVDTVAGIVLMAAVAVDRAQVESQVRLVVVSHAHDNSAPRAVHTLVECMRAACYVQIAAYRGLIMAPYIRNPRLF